MVGTLVLSILGYWFATLSYRLLLNKPRSTRAIESTWSYYFLMVALFRYIELKSNEKISSESWVLQFKQLK